ncbi:MAG TPA: MotA/TolQ/ExbB proton channel family protein, partial [Caldithrix sp.]|nr:MotA/TolQ/ExbB proton channel family protein [Caldithrix sp.]
MLELFSKGGWIMYFLLLSSIVALAVTIERLWYLRRKKILVPDIITALDQIRAPEDLNLTQSICRKFDGPFSRILLTTIENRDLSAEELRNLVEDDGRQAVRSLERGLGTLETVAAIAPLLGLLGTVLGMIKVFDVIQNLGVGQAKALSGGISEALITTAAGLMIGIPVLIVYNFFRHRSEVFILDIEKY